MEKRGEPAKRPTKNTSPPPRHPSHLRTEGSGRNNEFMESTGFDTRCRWHYRTVGNGMRFFFAFPRYRTLRHHRTLYIGEPSYSTPEKPFQVSVYPPSLPSPLNESGGEAGRRGGRRGQLPNKACAKAALLRQRRWPKRPLFRHANRISKAMGV